MLKILEMGARSIDMLAVWIELSTARGVAPLGQVEDCVADLSHLVQLLGLLLQTDKFNESN